MARTVAHFSAGCGEIWWNTFEQNQEKVADFRHFVDPLAPFW
jgi:hypothetical protein